MVWLRAKIGLKTRLRQFSTTVRRRIDDEGDWIYSQEWWGGSKSNGQTVFRSTSDRGNGVVSVVAYPASKPSRLYWTETEKWLDQRYAELNLGHERFKILGYQWRNLHFNDDTRQSTAKIMAAYRESDPGSVFIMQQANCLPVPYVKSMVSAGMAAIASARDYDLKSAVLGTKVMNILCIGHGGGSLPLFLASKIQGAIVHIVEIDPIVISASIRGMGFPSFSVVSPSGDHLQPKPNPLDELLWKGIHERLFLFESDAEKFVVETTNIYDMVFIDAYDGDDIFPSMLWDPNAPFLRALERQLHPEHGTVVVNLHSDLELDVDDDGSFRSAIHQIPNVGKYVLGVGQAYKEALMRNHHRGSGFAFNVAVPWLCNSSLVVSRNSGMLVNNNRDSALDILASKSIEVDNILNLPFSCLPYIKEGFTLLD
ncbi:uncharacterized protein LOC124921010 [Impatiens glandulifera]|uniref:uncharacterized protein LOC124921010 n=1 Tax=Impatiens glandulifera TaxID=253017 RepID=UPI001FB14CDB|nr:uncharacterized protein LOC124921010 [Impatiens glandulifera]